MRNTRAPGVTWRAHGVRVRRRGTDLHVRGHDAARVRRVRMRTGVLQGLVAAETSLSVRTLRRELKQ